MKTKNSISMRTFIALALASFLGITTSSAAERAEVSKARHGVIAADKKSGIHKYDPDGNVIWSFKAAPVHRIQQLTNGNILAQRGWRELVEVSPKGKVVWSYDAQNSNGNKGKKLEVHAFQRLENGNTMLVENGIGRIIEIDRNGKIKSEIKYQVKELSAHRDVRQGHKLKNGNYLICHEAEGRVSEYNSTGKIVWEYRVPMFGKKPARGHGPEAWGNQVFNAIRLPNDNTLIATGNGHSVLEVTPAKQIVWHLKQNDLPGITLAWVTSLELLPSGNVIIGNCHAGPDNPQLIEVSRNKQVVWTFKDFKNLGNATAASATVGVRGNVIR
ncbi:MAG: outer membrane protein assembly factor BamB [Limisphaerales bacterium]|jgi:outer membrane protein assembly factor BamB